MLLITSSQSQELDTRSMTEWSIRQGDLMSSAAQAILKSLREYFAQTSKFHRVLLLVGPGQNGGDALLVQKHWNQFFKSRPEFIIVKPDSAKVFDSHALEKNIPLEVDLIVDGFFGTGLKRDIEGPYRQIIERLKKAEAFVVAVDIPSGLDANTGNVRGVALKANLTVTFGASKPGLHQCDGPELTGRLRVDPILFPRPLLREIAKDHRAFGLKAAHRLLPPRPLAGHKGSFGQVYLFAGSEKYRGAGILAAKSALMTGAGYVHLVAEGKVYPEILRLPEVLYHDLEDFDFAKVDAAKASFVVGPGFAEPATVRKVLHGLLRIGAEKVLLDAEAFHVLKDGKFEGKALPATWLLTPHPGECAKLLETETAKIGEDRAAAAQQLQKLFGCVVLLKGFRTLVDDGVLKTWILSGNSALGKAGSGDVLSGVIAAFWAQDLETRNAALLGAFVHGYVATTYVREGNDAATLIPSRTIELLPHVMRQIRSSHS